MDTIATPWTTTLGTPASPKWDIDWLAEVERVETELANRICGAHTPAWTPCKLSASHPNGRCRFHGGAPGIGAPDGNRNAWIHGLYSRRLQQCGEHCPLWNHCPMAGKDVLTLSPPERPHCVYEQDEYESILSTFSLEKEKVEPKEINVEASRGRGGPPLRPDDLRPTNPQPPHTDPSASSHTSHSSHHSHSSPLCASASPREPSLIEKNVALFLVLLSRAQAALGVARLTDDTRARTLNYQMHSTKIAALVQAQLHIARELRAWLKLLPNFDQWRGLSPHDASIPPEAPEAEGIPMRMLKVLEDALGLPPGQKSAFSPRLPKRNPPTNLSPSPA